MQYIVIGFFKENYDIPLIKSIDCFDDVNSASKYMRFLCEQGYACNMYLSYKPIFFGH